MNKTICGELKYNNKKYYFNFKDDIITIQPKKMVNYSRWWFNYLGHEEDFSDNEINIEGVTSGGKYICFVHVRLRQIGSGVMQSFVPAYILGNSNNYNFLPKCKKVEKMIFEGRVLDRFCHPKKCIEYGDLYNKSDLTIKVNYDKLVQKKFVIDKNEYCYDTGYNFPGNTDLNNVLNVRALLKINFNTPKGVNEIIDYYKNVEKFFCFINNRRIIDFSSVKLMKKEKVRIDKDEVKDVDFVFTLYVAETSEKIDLPQNLDYVRLDDISDNYIELYKNIIKEDFYIEHYPFNKSEASYINNSKYTQLSSAFESEFGKLFPDFKSNINEAYKLVKNELLNYIEKRMFSLSNDNEKTQAPLARKEQKYYQYFYKVLENIDGNLEEKIGYAFNKYTNVFEKYRESLLKNYNIPKVKNGTLAKSFANRRNGKMHGMSIGKFTAEEIVSYELIKECVYCLTLERCGFSLEEIGKIVNKIFWN